MDGRAAVRRGSPDPGHRRRRLRAVAPRRRPDRPRLHGRRGRQLRHRLQGQRRPPRRPAAVHAGRGGHLRAPACHPALRRAVRRDPAHRLAGQPHRLRSSCRMEILRVGSVGTLHLLERAVADGARFLMASTSEAYGDPLVHPQPETLLGQRQPDRGPQRLRRGEALLRGGDDGVPPLPRARRGDRADLQHVRAADAPGRRPRHPDLHHPGAARRADHRARHRRRRPARSATSTTWCAASCCCSTRPRPARSTAAPSTR